MDKATATACWQKQCHSNVSSNNTICLTGINWKIHKPLLPSHGGRTVPARVAAACLSVVVADGTERCIRCRPQCST
eukprot:6632802-Pyramimonas_sp.AAC.1